MKMNLRSFILSISLALATILCGDVAARIAIVDISARNYESESSGFNSRQVYAAYYLCDIAGYQYVVTDDFDQAMKEDLILFADQMTNASFSQEELSSLAEWVKGEGTLVVPSIRNMQKKHIDRLDLNEVGLYNFEDYGDFWLSRPESSNLTSFSRKILKMISQNDLNINQYC